MPIITSSVRTWPVQYRSRLEYTLPGNNFVGRTRRQSQDVLTHAPKEWYEPVRRGGLNGESEDIIAFLDIFGPAMQFWKGYADFKYDLALKARFKLEQSEKRGTGTFDFAGKYPMTSQDFNDAFKIWEKVTDAYSFAKNARMTVESGNLNDSIRNWYASIKNSFMANMDNLSNAAEPGKEGLHGLGQWWLTAARGSWTGIKWAGGFVKTVGNWIIGAAKTPGGKAILATYTTLTIAGMAKDAIERWTNGRSPEELYAGPLKAVRESKYMTPDEKRMNEAALVGFQTADIRQYVANQGSFFGSVGGIAMIAAGLWVAYKLLMSPFASSIGAGLGQRLGGGGGGGGPTFPTSTTRRKKRRTPPASATAVLPVFTGRTGRTRGTSGRGRTP